METIVIFADAPSAYQELAAAARALGGAPVALYAGPREGAELIAGFGARVLYFGDVPEGALFEEAALPFAAALEREAPRLVLARSGKRAQQIAGRLAVRWNAPVINDASAVRLGDDAVEVEHLVYGGAAVRTERASERAIVLVPAGSFPVDEAPAAGAVEDQPETVEPGPIKLVGVQERQEETVDLGSAKCVFCVGRGIGGKENVEAVLEIAHKLGGEVGCTRPIAEGEGWLARSRYLGVSGASVKPQVYIGLGVSGQVQHTVGMADSGFVVAVNKDKNAPIMKQCDLGLVADVDAVLPALAQL